MSLQINIQFKQGSFNLCFKGELASGITGLFGSSGAGKTTLLHCIAGLVCPDRGQILLNGNLLYDSTSHHHLPPQKRQIGLVFQDHLLFPHLTVEGNLRYGQKKSRKERKKQLCEIVELLEISHLLNRNVRQLSGGEKQRVALGRAILTDPKLLLLDEPFTGLDQGLKRQLILYLKRLHENTKIPMVLVSHSLKDISGLTDEIIFIEDGRFFAQGQFTCHGPGQPTRRFCGSGTSDNVRLMRTHLTSNHTLRFSVSDEKTKAV